MFRGGDYVDDPKFHDGNYSVKNTLDITVRSPHNLNQIGYCRSITKK
jgi:hypothetical protein